MHGHVSIKLISLSHTRHVSAENVKEKLCPPSAFYILVVSSHDGRNCQPKHVVYVTKKWMSERLWCCIERLTTGIVK
jgi:hypothetical protein